MDSKYLSRRTSLTILKASASCFKSYLESYKKEDFMPKNMNPDEYLDVTDCQANHQIH